MADLMLPGSVLWLVSLRDVRVDGVDRLEASEPVGVVQQDRVDLREPFVHVTAKRADLRTEVAAQQR